MFSYFFFNETATTEIYTLSLHDALPISSASWRRLRSRSKNTSTLHLSTRSEEHTSELQSPCNLVCRLLLEKKNKWKRFGYRLRNHNQSIQANEPRRKC